ncbi:MAG: Reverse gyrase [Methanoregula sp. PtaU1.Bin051]|nr:MAG: Reverse gyrase [Methanoregula sp. PtaU1.Bin051]
MHLIVAEKNISARRIAQILAEGKKVTEKKDAGVSVYYFGEAAAIGLRGHVVEVDFEPGYQNWRSASATPRHLIDAKTIKVPTEKKIVTLLQKMARQAARVTIATDFDTEGELIGKEAFELIRAVNKSVPIDRARFSAITPQEIIAAFSHTTDLDFSLASAGEARQLIDLMWGASLTRFISLAARRGGQNILSVGRVQSPTLTMIVDREKEIESFVPEKYWQLSLTTIKGENFVEARHTHGRFKVKSAAEFARDQTKEPLVVTEVSQGSKVDRSPSPFDTTSFIVAAARLGFSAANAMRIAEDLYMNGFISYPRTDNTIYPATLDLNGILSVLKNSPFRKDVEWVIANRRAVPTRGKKSSTDHPPIHPTAPATKDILGEGTFALYELVLRRFLATLAPDAQWQTLKVLFDAGGEEYTATGGRLVSPGWHTVYPFSEAKETILPVFTVGEKLPIKKVAFEEKETQPPARYTQSKLIQRMEELGLGTKSTRHEVIAKLVSRKYVEGTPLRPTLVGRVVIESLEKHADTITKPDMTRTLDAHMQQIKQSQRTREDVVRESREMLHAAFDQLEAHERVIGDEIRSRTAEEMTLGMCPVCRNGTLSIKHMRGSAQFIGCSRYPDCTFNIGLPLAQWGYAVRTDEVCQKHGLNFVRLVRKGSRPWDIGCPLCHHISTNRESLSEIPFLTPDLLDRLESLHIYTASDLAKSKIPWLITSLDITKERAEQLVKDANAVMELLRKRSECRKFMREHIVPRKGRSYAAILKSLAAAGIRDIAGLASADPATLHNAGIGEKEAAELINGARARSATQLFKKIGIPAPSIKKYVSAGIFSPEEFCTVLPLTLADKAGVSPDTVYRHAGLVCKYLNLPVPKKVTKAQLEKGRKELLAIRGVNESIINLLLMAGIIDTASLLAADPRTSAMQAGLPEESIRKLQTLARKKLENAIIQL